jgi:hypothetical protein
VDRGARAAGTQLVVAAVAVEAKPAGACNGRRPGQAVARLAAADLAGGACDVVAFAGGTIVGPTVERD